MMDDLISRQVAINNIKNGFHWETVNGIMAQAVLKQVIHDIEIMPSAQPERKNGKWIWMGDKGDSRFMCSVCKAKENVPTCNGEPTIWEFCPNCGAEMQKAREKNADANT